MAHMFVNNPPPFPSRPRSQAPSASSSSSGATGAAAATINSRAAPPRPPQASSRQVGPGPLPEFGNPNEFPNPPSHYFPSRPNPNRRNIGSTGGPAARIQSELASTTSPDNATEAEQEAIAALVGASQQGQRHQSSIGQRPPDAGGQPFPSQRAANSSSGVSFNSRRLSDRTSWDAGSQLLRDTALLDQRRDSKRKASDDDDDQDGDDDDAEGDADGDISMSVADGSVAGDAASVHSQTPSGKDLADDPTGKENLKDGSLPKKRSRTLTTAHQTAVLNALLAKTRFPSTETREEVGRQIGMSARRVQIWFQNRRQSQKRLRDREASELGTQHSAHVGQSAQQMHYEYQQQQQQQAAQQQQQARISPFARGVYPPGPSTVSSSSSTSTARPELSRQISIESVGSYTSAHSSVGSYRTQQQRDTVTPLSDVPPRWPVTSQAYGSGGWHSQARGQLSPTDTSRRHNYFPPPPPRPAPLDPENRPTSANSETGPRLPSLSSVFGSALPDSPEKPFSRPAFTGPFGDRGPPPAPSSGTRAITNPHVLQPMSPGPSTLAAPSESFSRLRLSSTDGSAPTRPRHESPPDVLDAVMETVYRPTNVVPARASLPPLRSPNGRPSSEADAALLAPILPAGQAMNATKQLPPISSLTDPIGPTQRLSSMSLPFPSRERGYSSSTASHAASTSTGGLGSSLLNAGSAGAPRSSVSSFETLGTNGWAPTSIGSSSRTSFSSEVQDEWDRVSREQNLSAARKVKAVEVSPWDDRRGMAGGGVAIGQQPALAASQRSNNATPLPLSDSHARGA